MGNLNFNAAADLSDLVTRVFISPLGESITDIYIQPDLPWRARIATQEWFDIKNPQEPDRPILYTKDRFEQAMAMFFSKDGRTPNNAWQAVVREAGGCAYPVFTMDVPSEVTERVEDSDEDGKYLQVALQPVTREFRIRGTLQQQNSGGYGVMLRCLREVPESLESVNLPDALETFLQQRSGLILVTGPTGAGKSTTIAAMVNLINSTRAANILMLEDPTEYLHKPKKGVVISREVGVDVDSYKMGVEQALRFVPDVIVIGEIRDAETMRTAVRAGESGHLVITTMHAPTALGAVRKALGYLDTPGEQMSFAGCLVGIMAQTLIPRINGGKAVGFELLDCRHGVENESKGTMTVQKLIGDVIGGAGEEPFTNFATGFRNGKAGGPLSVHFSTSLKRLVGSGEVERSRAAAVAPDRQTMNELMQRP